MLSDSHRISDLERKVASVAQLLNGCTPQRVMDYTGYIYSVLGASVGYRGVLASSATAAPWDVTMKVDPDNPDGYLATVNPGLIGGILPSNWDAEFEVSGSSIHYAIAVIQTDGTAINGVSIEIRTTAPQSQTPELWATPASVEYLFGLIKEGSVKRVIGPGNITLMPKVWLTVEKDAPVGPGELAYDRYYALA